jgi:hypothetical protein
MSELKDYSQIRPSTPSEMFNVLYNLAEVREKINFGYIENDYLPETKTDQFFELNSINSELSDEWLAVLPVSSVDEAVSTLAWILKDEIEKAGMSSFVNTNFFIWLANE